MKYRRLESGDYTFGKGNQNFYNGTVAVSQAIKTRLLLLKNEWWEDTEDGLDLFQNILGKYATESNLHSIDLLIQDRIITTPDVISIENFISSYNNRIYTVNCIAVTKYGDASLEVTF